MKSKLLVQISSLGQNVVRSATAAKTFARNCQKRAAGLSLAKTLMAIMLACFGMSTTTHAQARLGPSDEILKLWLNGQEVIVEKRSVLPDRKVRLESMKIVDIKLTTYKEDHDSSPLNDNIGLAICEFRYPFGDGSITFTATFAYKWNMGVPEKEAHAKDRHYSGTQVTSSASLFL